MDIRNAIQKFKYELVERGHPEEIVWLQGDQMWLTKGGLNVYMSPGFPYETHVLQAYTKIEADLDCGATLMLVCVKGGFSYCTFLVDSFGSDSDTEYEEGFYLWCDPYVRDFKTVLSTWRWVWLTKIRKEHQLSSLDYAFSLKQAFI